MLCCVVLLALIAPIRRFTDQSPLGQRGSVSRWIVLAAGATALIAVELGTAFGLSHLIEHSAHTGAAPPMQMSHAHHLADAA